MRFVFIALSLLLALPSAAQTPPPVRIAIVGMSHGHVGWILGRADRGDVQIVGIYETDQPLIDRLAGQYRFDKALVYGDLDTMLDEVKPEAVVVFGSIFDHLAAVEAAAPRKIHVMVEKPLAANLEHARMVEALARQNGIHLLVNYGMAWYATTGTIQQVVQDGTLGLVQKIVVQGGHPEPVETGCYGADLATMVMSGEAPLTVTAVTQKVKPDKHPKVDEATFILTYPKAQAILQASWNWPLNRKDLEVYGTKSYIKTDDGLRMHLRKGPEGQDITILLEPRPITLGDSFSYFAAVVRGDVVAGDEDLSSLPINMTVMRILDAVSRSAKSGKTVTLAGP